MRYTLNRGIVEAEITGRLDPAESEATMTHELEIAILKQDRCTSKEAERFLKNGTTIYENPEEYISMLKDNGVYEGETLDDFRRGAPDISMVWHNDHEYLVAYVN